jgi:hypothetical protein
MTLKDAVARYNEVLSGIEDLQLETQVRIDERDYLIQQLIPQLMHEAGQSSCSLDSGEKINLETVWAIEVPKMDGANDYGPIAAWLREKGFEAIIQDQVKFQKGVDLSCIFSELDEKGIGYQRGSSVHWMSLRKVIKEHMETGGDAPPESAAIVRVFEQAKIKKG